MLRSFFGILGLTLLGPALKSQPLPNEARQQQQIRKYEELTRDNPRDVEFWHVLGDLYRDAEQWDKAIRAESEALRLHPKYAVAFYGRGKARMGKGDYSGAVEDFTSSIQLFEIRGGLERYLTLEQPSTDYIDCYRTRGVALSHLNRFKEGVGDLSTALRLHRDDAKLLYERGYLEEKAGLKTEAVPDYHRAGLLYADASARPAAQECIARLDTLGARSEADAIRLKLAPKTPVSDLPR